MRSSVLVLAVVVAWVSLSALPAWGQSKPSINKTATSENDPDPTHQRLAEEVAAPPFKPVLASGAVLDLCALRPKGKKTQFEKQRALIFAPGGAAEIEGNARLAKLHAATHAASVWLARFPLDRFANVETAITADPAWVGEGSIKVQDVRTYASRAPITTPFAGDVDPTKNEALAKKEREMVVYSAACADWLFVPKIKLLPVWDYRYVELAEVHAGGGSAGSSLKRSPKKLYYAEWRAEITVTVFRRDGVSFDRVATFTSTGAKTNAKDFSPDIPKTGGLPPFVSAVPDVACALPPPVDGRANLTACARGTGNSSMIQDENQFEEFYHVCHERRLDNPDVWTLCELRKATESALAEVQFKVRGMEVFRLFGVLDADIHGDPVTSLGREEGTKVGYGFYVKAGKRIAAFYKVTSVGPGGKFGDSVKTELDRRFGEAPYGSRLDEYVQNGFILMPRADFTSFFGNAPATTVHDGGRQLVVGMPTSLRGGSLAFGFNFSGATGVSELWSRVDVGVLQGTGTGVDVLLVPIDWPVLEKGFYLGERLKLVADVGYVWEYYNLNFKTLAKPTKLQGLIPGGMASLGLDLMLTPEWSVRAALSGRVHGAPSYADPKHASEIPIELQGRTDQFAMLGSRVGVGYTW